MWEKGTPLPDDPTPRVSDIWTVLGLNAVVEKRGNTDLCVGVLLLMVGAFCICCPKAIPFTGGGRPAGEDEPTSRALRVCRIIGALCVLLGIALLVNYVWQAYVFKARYGVYLGG